MQVQWEWGLERRTVIKALVQKLIEFLISWAKGQKGLEKICLGVVSINDRAIKVYKRMGFVEEGRQIKQIKYEDGSYGDDVLMGLYIE